MKEEKEFVLKNKEDMLHLVQDLVKNIHESSNLSYLVLLSGELGSGKTTFVQEFTKYLGIESFIKSPTFVLMKSYDVDSRILPNIKKIHHIDAYRLVTEEAHHLKINELLKEENVLIFIEWPEQINMDNEKSFATVSFIVNDDESRSIKLHYN